MMLVEMEFIEYRPRAGKVVADAYGAAIGEGKAPGTLAGFWSVDVGLLNSAVALWTYDDQTQEELARRAANAWPPALDGVVIATNSLLLEPARFNEPLVPGAYGAFYEIRIYDYETGSVATVIDRWADMVEARTQLSRLTGCFAGNDGVVDKWVHIWPYADGAERDFARTEAASRGIWPPETGEWLLHQENMIVIPTAFSPLH